MTKKEAAEYLGVSERTIERYVSAGKLTPEDGGFDPVQVRALKSTPKRSRVPVESKLTLSLEEASEVSGLPVFVLERAIREGKLKRLKETGGIKRSDLDKYVKTL